MLPIGIPGDVPIGPVHRLDVSGLYPYVMQRFLFPRRRVDYRETLVPGDHYDLDVLARSLAEVQLDSATDCYPVRTKAGTVYAAGHVETVLAGPELVQAAAKGHLRRVGMITSYELADLFSEYVAEWWNRRLDAEATGDLVLANLAKAFLVSLPGKFGQMTPEWETMAGESPTQPWGVYVDRDPADAKPRWCRAIGNVLQVRRKDKERADNFPAVSAWVTSHGRLLMNQLRHQAGAREVYYQGVDSLHVSTRGLSRLMKAGTMHARELGKLRVEESTPWAVYWGCNDYETASRRVAAGVGRVIVRSPDGLPYQERFRSLRSLLRNQPPDGVPLDMQPVPVREPYARGVIGVDGWVLPILRKDW